jgi:cytoskeletal protein RodZ
MKTWLQLAAAAVVLTLGISVFVAWRGVRQEQAQLQEKLKTAQQAVTDANTRQETRQTALQQQLAALQKEQAAVRSPQQVVEDLPAVLPLPKPLLIEETSQNGAAGEAGGKGKPDAPSPKVILPLEDLKPLYDSAVACKECQVQLKAVQANLADEKVKTQALGKERDDAVKAAKGGSVLRRVARAAKWFAIGAAAGAVAAKMTR